MICRDKPLSNVIKRVTLYRGMEREIEIVPVIRTSRYGSTWDRQVLLDEIELFFFVQVIHLYFYPVDMRSKYNMVKTGRVKYSWSKWEDERLQGLRGLERAPSLAGVERRTSRPHRRAHRRFHHLNPQILGQNNPLQGWKTDRIQR